MPHFKRAAASLSGGFRLASHRSSSRRNRSRAAAEFVLAVGVSPRSRGKLQTRARRGGRHNRSPARSRRRSAGLSGRFVPSPAGTAPFRNNLVKPVNNAARPCSQNFLETNDQMAESPTSFSGTTHAKGARPDLVANEEDGPLTAVEVEDPRGTQAFIRRTPHPIAGQPQRFSDIES